MQPLLYGELVPWYRLIDPPGEHLDEALSYQHALEQAAPAPETLLELGAGAGHNAVHLKRRFRCTLTDISAPMQSLSRDLNPDCEHVAGDMRTLRLGRTFDAVLVHDAIMYMTSEEDLRAAIETASVHLRPGGAAVFAPDFVRETFRETSELHQGEDGKRALRCLEWVWDPDPNDTTCVAEFAFLLRDGAHLKAVHDRHVVGLFPRATWVQALEAAGFQVHTARRPLGDGDFDEVFVGRK